jgi:hypothetical protein
MVLTFQLKDAAWLIQLKKKTTRSNFRKHTCWQKHTETESERMGNDTKQVADPNKQE